MRKLRIFAPAILILVLSLTASAAAIKNKRPKGATLNLTKTLKEGMTDPGVLILQKILNSNPDTRVSDANAGSPGNETDYFGGKTKAAVIKFGNYYKKEIDGANQSIYFNPALTPPPSQITQGIVDWAPKRFMNTLPEDLGEAPVPASEPPSSPPVPVPSGGGNSGNNNQPVYDFASTTGNRQKEQGEGFGGIITSYTFCNCNGGFRLKVMGSFGGDYLFVPGKTKNFGSIFTAGPVLGSYKKGGSCEFGPSGCGHDDPISKLTIKGTIEEMTSMLFN